MIATTIEQSKHLLELGLDPKTADMFWKYSASLGNTDINGRIAVSYHDNLFVGKCDGAIPAWSLSALLEVMPYDQRPSLCSEPIRCWKCTARQHDTRAFIDSVDSAFEMVCWLLRNTKHYSPHARKPRMRLVTLTVTLKL